MYSSRPPFFSLNKKRNKKKLQFSIVDFVILMRKRGKKKKCVKLFFRFYKKYKQFI
jgi:hypothetical protein